ncbi:MAG: ATP-binding cassette domain-containing protein [Clostridia bacterium]|nr:ATP-binding cassette domain-containing protein [Clostridia bacterium]
MYSFENINYQYKSNKKVLHDISFSIPENCFNVLIGDNGCGKTTLLKVVYGILKCDSYSVQGGIECSDMALVGDAEEVNWCDGMRGSDDNVKLLLPLHKNFSYSKYEKLITAMGWSQEDRRKRYLTLSTGQMMQFQLAFNLAKNPKLLLMDEPLANLDPMIKHDLIKIIQEEISDRDLTVLMSTHLIDEVSEVTDYLVRMEKGTVKAEGYTEDLEKQYGVSSIWDLLSKC